MKRVLRVYENLLYCRLTCNSTYFNLAEPCDASAHHQSIGATNKHVISVKVKRFCALCFKVHQMNLHHITTHLHVLN